MMVMNVSIFSDCELVALLEDDTGMEVSLHRKNISPYEDLNVENYLYILSHVTAILSVTIFLDLFPCAGYFFNAFD